MKQRAQRLLRSQVLPDFLIVFGSILSILGVILYFDFSPQIQDVAAYGKSVKTYDSVVDGYDARAMQQIHDAKLTPTKEPTISYKIPILMYHYVEYVKDRKDTTRIKLAVPPNVFEMHLQALEKNANKTAFAREIPEIMSGTMAYDPKIVVLTFDDGYEDFYTEVFPLLKKYHMKATVYIIYDYIGRKDFLKYDQIRELIDSGLVEVGSHTLDHLYLKEVSHDVAKTQIIDSKKKLEDTFNIVIHTFAYPFGAYNDDVVQLSKEAGYDIAVTVVPGNMATSENLFTLPRIRPEQFSASNFAVELENYNPQ